mgnify:FL=1
MARTPEEGKGVLFTNMKRTSDKAPDFTGDIMHNGEVIKLSAWKRQSAYGELLSLSISNWPPNKGTGQPKPQQQYPRPVQQDDGGDVPW